jgi:hypothetical protein
MTCLTRRYAYSRRAALGWGLAMLLTGPLGILLLLSTRGLPRLVACPHCGKRRPLDQEHCPHCAGDFPPPPADGTEVFAFASLAQG